MIQLQNITVQYGQMIALHPTSLTFQQGQFSVLLGASGAGKSTMLRCLNLMQKPTSGNINIAMLGSLSDKKYCKSIVGVLA